MNKSAASTSTMSKKIPYFCGKLHCTMKKGLTFLIINLLAINLFAQEWVDCGSDNPHAPSIKLISCSEQETTVSFALQGFFREAVNTPNGPQYRITVPKMASMLEEAAPDLPLFAIPILIGDFDEMKIEVKEAEYQEFQMMEIVPSKGNFSREIDPETVPFRYGEAYSQNRFFPDFQAQLDQPYILRDCRGQNILVYPFAYNPMAKTLRVYTHLTLMMKKVGDMGDNPKIARKKGATKLSPETQEMYRHRFINYQEESAKYTFIPDEGELLVICPPAYLAAMQPFVEWKNESGRPTTMVSLSDIGGNNANQIKSFILSHYENPDENLCYVLLVGDYSDLTPKSMNGGASDIWFGQIEGNDNYPEILVGRFSVGSVADVQNQVAKVIYYERDITADALWLDKGIGIGSTEGAGNGHNGGESDYMHIEYIRDTLLHYTYSEVSRHYHGVGVGTNAAMLSENFNAGAGICNYCNHGTTTGWYVGSFNNSHVNALVNDYKWPFIWSTACYNGQFDVNCFAEAWMRATNNATGIPTGAIGGMFSWISQPWQPPMTGQDEMVDILCEWRSANQFHHTLGGASLNGNMKILDMHPNDYGNTHNTWILFGDPSLLLRTDNPTEMNVMCQPEAIFIGQTELTLTADTDYALATLSNNGEVLCSTPIINGEATLSFISPENVGTAKLVVTGFNKVTHFQDIQIIPANGPFLTYDSFSINDANGQADYGETFNLDLTLKNLGNEPAANVQVSLSTDSPFVNILNGTAILPSIGSLESQTITNGFQITVNELITDGIQADFTIICTEGEQVWESHFRMKLHAPAFALTEFRPVSTAHPGVVDTLLIGVKNIGSSDAHQAQIQLFSSSTELNFNQMDYFIGDIPAGNIATIMAVFNTSIEVPIGSSFEVYYLMDAGLYALSGIESVNIGPVKETFETGDFSAFDWETLGGSHWFVDNSTSSTGTYSARSGAIGHANLTTLQVEIEVSEDGQISFFKKICTEANKDKLTFYIDNTAKGEWSGEINWSRETYPVTAGTHKFKWIYMKDSNGSYGDDCCWIDDIQFPASQIVTLLPALEVEAQVNLNEITLSWGSMSSNENYIIRRDGEQIAVQHETVFTELQDIGTYLYSITAFNDEHQLSIPSFVTVTVDTVGTSEMANKVQVFPNPVHNILYVSLGQAFNYRIFNYLGQQISSGESAGATQIQCANMTKGLYFIQIATGSEITTKKFVVQ